jgi:hypothetical protein
MNKKLVTISAKFLKMHNVSYIGNSYLQTKEGGVLTYRYIFEWLKKYGAVEFCSQSIFKKFIEQLIFETELSK